MTRFLCILLSLMLLLSCAVAEGTASEPEAAAASSANEEGAEESTGTAFDPIPWNVTVSPNKPNQACYLPDDAGYHDDSIDVRIETFNADNGTLCYAMSITIVDPSQLRLGTQGSRPPYQQTAFVWKMTERFNAVCAINDDYFGYHNEGIVYRNGVQVRMNPSIRRDELIIDDKGDFHVITGTNKEKWNAYEGTVVHALCFGPALVIDGEVNKDAYNTKMNIGKDKKTQRIAIGQTGPLQYLVIATNGPENKLKGGLNLMEMAELCKQKGMITAYNLDGGSSSSVVLNNKKINGIGSKKRAVGGCIWFATLVPNE